MAIPRAYADSAFIQPTDAERFVEYVRKDDPDVATSLDRTRLRGLRRGCIAAERPSRRGLGARHLLGVLVSLPRGTGERGYSETAANPSVVCFESEGLPV